MCPIHKKTTFLKIAIGGLLFLALIPWVTLLLWNWLMPDIFGLTEISYWQALGLLILSKILFSGFTHGKHQHHKHPSTSHFYYDKIKDKMKRMTPDERKAYFMRCNISAPKEETPQSEE